jgi:alpha-L-rhamnosidase
VSQPLEFLAYAKAGHVVELLARLRSVWGGLLDLGYTRFPEDIRPRDTSEQQLPFYDRPFGNSLCHAWAGAAPVLGLVRGVLGIWPIGGGYRNCRIAPNLGGLEWVRGSVPVPSGDIKLEIDSHGARVTLPPQVVADLSGYVTSDGRNRLSGPGTFQLLAAHSAIR